mmetsp:Transcript_32449/g.103470  ORF Transcript_32449/g.103470 Transcript_32449/m.103470 type:complete len:216 (-) Transcript_32449:1716-2363(-)
MTSRRSHGLPRRKLRLRCTSWGRWRSSRLSLPPAASWTGRCRLRPRRRWLHCARRLWREWRCLREGERGPPPRATMPAPGGPWCPASLARCSTSPQPQPPSTRRAPSRCATLTRASRFGAFPEGTSSPPAPSTNSSPPRARSASKLAARSPAPRSGPASPPLNWPPSAAPRSTPLGCRASSRAPAVPISGTRSRAGCSGSTLRRTRTPSPKWRAT